MSPWKYTTLFSYVIEHLSVFYNTCHKSIKPLIPSIPLLVFWILQAISLVCYSLKYCVSERAIPISIHSRK